MKPLLILFSSALCLTSALHNSTVTSSEPTVDLSDGPVVGKVITTAWGNQSYAFLGIPYAQPPVNSLRFAPPVPAGNWSDPLICQSYKPACPQNSTTSQTKQTSIDEDCLYLNVFVPTTCNETHPCAVIYYIHGGGNEFDSVWNFPQEVLVDNYSPRRVIFITMGYRLGVLGFFSTGTKEFPGNMALKDILLGLKWVAKNINMFGGDPTRVSIMGHSTSAALVSLMTISPPTRGLFHQAISMSGTGFMPNAIGTGPNPRDKLLAEQLNCTSNREWTNKEFNSVVNCLRNVSWEEMTQTYLHPTEGPDLTGLGSWPVYDGVGGIFPVPFDILVKTRRPLPFMIGTVSREFPEYLNESSITTVYEACLMATVLKGYRNRLAISSACAIHYAKHSYDDTNSYPPDGINSKLDTAVVSIMNDIGIYNPTYEDAKSLTERGGKAFLYEFEYALEGQEQYTPYHSFDLTFVTGNHWNKINLTANDQRIRDIYVSLFTNFVKFGNPTPLEKSYRTKWFPLGSNGAANYYAINLPQPRNKISYHYEGNLFWDTIAPAMEKMLSGDNKKPRGPFVSNLVAVNHVSSAEQPKSVGNNTVLIASLAGSACLLTGVLVALMRVKIARGRGNQSDEKKLLLQETQQYKTF